MPWKTLHFKRPKVNENFDSVGSNHLDKAQHTMAIEQMENYDFVLKGANVKIPKKTTDNVIKSNKCNQCDYASSRGSTLGQHLKTHNGERSKKCNQCDFASIQAGDLKRHLLTHSGEKPNKCNLGCLGAVQTIV